MRHLRTVLMTESPLARYQSAATRRVVDRDVVLMETGVAEGCQRHALVLGEVAPVEFFGQVLASFGDGRVDGVELASEHASALEAELLRRGWRLTEEEPALVLDRVPEPLPAPPAELEIRRALDETGLEDFYAISRTGRQWVPSVESIRDPRVAVLVGYVDGQAVATARVSGHGAVTDVMGVVTRPEYRRRGYGTAMTWAAVAAGRAMGSQAFLLTASEMGYPVYVKMGFVPVCTMRTYEPPSSAPPSPETRES
jgi:GNAT superfamily N-acetyltransferase